MPSVVDYETFIIPPRFLCLYIETDDGLVGWGEPTSGGYAEIIQTAIDVLMENFVIGSDLDQIEDLWQQMFHGGFYRGGPVLSSAISGIDQALWDLKGRRHDLPVYEFLSGRVRDRIRVYQLIGGEQTSNIMGTAEAAIEAGITALKMNATTQIRFIDTPSKIEETCARIAKIREAVGSDIDLAVDFHGRVAKPMTLRLTSALEQFDPMFIEEPVPPEHNNQLPEVASGTNIPIATGGRSYSLGEFRQLFHQKSVDLIQPSVSHASGITAVNKIANMAEAHNVAITPHSPTGPISFAACLHIGIASPNVLIQQQPIDVLEGQGGSTFNELVEGRPFEYANGFIEAPTGPGLGVEIDESFLREHAQSDVEFRFPVWRHEDGSIARW